MLQAPRNGLGLVEYAGVSALLYRRAVGYGLGGGDVDQRGEVLFHWLMTEVAAFVTLVGDARYYRSESFQLYRQVFH